MAEHCTRFTRAHNIPHVSLRIPWGSADYPARPAPEASFERIARDARQRLFLDYMHREDVKCSVLATGHHLDDQVETLLMGRVVSAASSQTISSYRRWGMGDARPVDSSGSSLAFFGVRGMDKWIIRPLLPFSKVIFPNNIPSPS